MIHSYIHIVYTYIPWLSFFPCPSNFILLNFVVLSHCDGSGWLTIRFVYRMLYSVSSLYV